MTSWKNRASEEISLFNPSFCAILLWCAVASTSAEGAEIELTSGIEIEALYLVLPFVLHRGTREALPRGTRTSLPSWASENSLLCLLLVERARALVPFTREALNFGCRYSLLTLDRGIVHANMTWKKRIEGFSKKSTTEVKECIKKASLTGKWFQRTGDAATVMAILGVRP